MTDLSEHTASHLADLFGTLSDASRLRIIDSLLGRERSVGEIASRLGMTESAVSHQLRRLRDMRLVRIRKDGRQVFYSLDDDHVARLFEMGLEHVIHG
jgi:DNA-binding transcriptional ArsR family regulator